MSEWGRLRRGLIAGVIGAVGSWLLGSWIGCSRNDTKPEDRSNQGEKRTQVPTGPDYSDLRGVLLGGWAKLDAVEGGFEYTLTCSPKTLVVKFREDGRGPRHFGPRVNGNVICSYQRDGDRIEITDSQGMTASFICEFISESEVAFAPVKHKGTERQATDRDMILAFSGRWKRTSRPLDSPIVPAPDTSPIAVAKKQIDRIEQKLLKVESLQREAQKERDEMVAKLRELGIESAADLKKNPRGQRMAENLAKLAAEIDGMGSQLATIDTELLKARSIVRRMEREQAGITDDEMRQLSQQLREAEARTDTAPRPITPVDVDAALEAAFKARKPSPRDKR